MPTVTERQLDGNWAVVNGEPRGFLLLIKNNTNFYFSFTYKNGGMRKWRDAEGHPRMKAWSKKIYFSFTYKK